MQAPDMRTFRSFHCRTLRRFLSLQNPNPICISRIYPQFPRKFLSTPHRHFSSSAAAADEPTTHSWSMFPNATPPPPPVESTSPQTPEVETAYDPATNSSIATAAAAAADEPTTHSWSMFPNATPPPPPVESTSRQTPEVETVYDPATDRLVTNSSIAIAAAADEPTTHSWSAFPNATPPPPPVESTSPQTPEVETVYDPTTGGLVTKRNHYGRKAPESGGEKVENQPPVTEVGSRVYGDVMGSSSSAWNSNIKKKKTKTVYVCSSCGYSNGQWWGTCNECKEVGKMTPVVTEGWNQAYRKVTGVQVTENVVRSWLPREAPPVKLTDVYDRVDDLNWRTPLPGEFGDEVGRVLGGGLVPGSLVLLGGDPGIGKSTLLLQVAALIAKGNGRVIYVSGEESVEQIANRADRLSIKTEDVFLHSSTDIEDILQQAQSLSPKALVIDSIQTVHLNGVSGSGGSVNQVRECSAALLRYAKKTNTPVLLIGHVTKSGDIAGPRALEHIVDVVLYMEGEKCSSHRLLRPVKNRFGSTDELGIFKMTEFGLQAVLNPSEMFLADQQHSNSAYLAGLAISVIMDGSRAFLIEVQALCIPDSSSSVRHLNGVQGSRADMIISVLTKQAGIKLQENGVYINVVSGVIMKDTAGDLAIAAAICSSFLDFPIPRGIAFIAEVGLGGELHMVPQLDKRVITVAKLGYKKCIIPKTSENFFSDMEPGGMEIVGCNNLKEMIEAVFTGK